MLYNGKELEIEADYFTDSQGKEGVKGTCPVCGKVFTSKTYDTKQGLFPLSECTEMEWKVVWHVRNKHLPGIQKRRGIKSFSGTLDGRTFVVHDVCPYCDEEIDYDSFVDRYPSWFTCPACGKTGRLKITSR